MFHPKHLDICAQVKSLLYSKFARLDTTNINACNASIHHVDMSEIFKKYNNVPTA